jgi:rhodanese-related sulfurtransferase
MSGPQPSQTASSPSGGYAGDLTPRESWELLSKEGAGQLVDVRTQAEWNFVGVPDLSPLERRVVFCEWQRFPAGSNPGFVAEVIEALKRTNHRKGAPLLMLCRSGARSRSAAIALTAAGYGPCFNIKDGFEGALDPERHRGGAAGWKAEGLPWIQT